MRFWFICFIVLFVFAASIPFIILEKQQRRDDVKIDLENMLNVQQLAIDTWLKERMMTIRSLAELPSIKGNDLEKSIEIFDSFDKNQNEFEGIVFVNSKGITEIDTSGTPGLDVSDRIYFEQAKIGNSFITDVIIGKQSKKPIIIVSAPVYDKKMNFQGLVFGSVSINTVNQVLKQFQDGNRETYLVDRNGMIITESRQGTIGERIETDIFENALNGKYIDQFYKTSNGDSVMGSYKWVHHNQWLIIGEVNKKTIYQPFYNMVLYFAGIIFLLILIGYVLMIAVSKKIEQPIQRVLDGTKRFSIGDWSYRLDLETYQHEIREFHELSANFNNMASVIESHIASIAKSEERFRTITEYSSDMITIHDANGNYLYVSPAGKEILQYDDHEILGHDSYIFIHPDDREQIAKSHEKLLKDGYVVSTYRIKRKDNEYIWFESSIKFMKEQNEEDSRIYTISRNITERKLVEQQLKEANKLLRELSTKDGLTGIWNRRSFDERIELEWEKACENNQPLSLIMLDIDFFKAYNDTYGHQRGDDCLKEVANAISNACKLDTVFRYGGEEFAMILPKINEGKAKIVAENTREIVEKLNIPHVGSKIENHVTISLGTATIIPTKYGSPLQLIEAADKALYQAKQDGRNCVKSYYQ